MTNKLKNGLVALITSILPLTPVSSQEDLFIRGDTSMDFIVDITDPVMTLEHLYTGKQKLKCEDAADADDSGVIEMTDSLLTLNKLFFGIPNKLPLPRNSPGTDSTSDNLSCNPHVESCIDQCSQINESIFCGSYATSTCFKNEEGCLIKGECISTYRGDPKIAFNGVLNAVENYHLSGKKVNEGSTLPRGQKFKIFNSFFDFGVVGLKSSNIEVRRNNELVDILESECRIADKNKLDQYRCNTFWNSNNIPVGPGDYKFTFVYEDNLGRVVLKDSEIFPLIFSAQNPSLCKPLVEGHNLPGDNRLNLVLQMFGYDEDKNGIPRDKGLMVARKYIDFNGDLGGLFSISPFRENKDLFNIWYIDRIGTVEESESDINPEFYSCTESNMHVIRLTSHSVIGSPSKMSGVISYNSGKVREGLRSLFLHEFGGHNIGGLRDEYSLRDIIPDGNYHNNIKDNCFFGTFKECEKDSPWAFMLGDGCGEEGILDCDESDPNHKYEIRCDNGCAGVRGYNSLGEGYHKSSKASVMTSASFREFNKYNEHLILLRMREELADPNW